jgi:hypothetical protein
VNSFLPKNEVSTEAGQFHLPSNRVGRTLVLTQGGKSRTALHSIFPANGDPRATVLNWPAAATHRTDANGCCRGIAAIGGLSLEPTADPAPWRSAFTRHSDNWQHFKRSGASRVRCVAFVIEPRHRPSTSRAWGANRNTPAPATFSALPVFGALPTLCPRPDGMKRADSLHERKSDAVARGRDVAKKEHRSRDQKSEWKDRRSRQLRQRHFRHETRNASGRVRPWPGRGYPVTHGEHGPARP